MDSAFLTRLATQAESLREQGLFKNERVLGSPQQPLVQVNGREYINLCANNYLGLANHPAVREAAHTALDQYGYGMASVRFICGTQTPHRELEQRLSAYLGTEDTILYSSCFDANGGLFETLLDEQDAVISDALNHAALIDGCRMSKAKRHVYPHSDMAALEQKLVESKDARRVFIVTDGVFSMEGDIAKLTEIVVLAKKYNASIILDDSHGVGVMGEHGRGTAEHFDVEKEIDIVTGTLGKALGGAAGGSVAASQTVIDYLQQVSRPQLFSNALPATIAGSALKAIEILQAEPGRVARLHAITHTMRDGLQKLGFKPLEGESAIIPIIVGETAFAIRMSQALLDEGIFITGFGYPVVPEGAARLRLQMCATLTDGDIAFALATFEKVGKRLKVI